ncbi:hypothetical protein KP509_36G045200 [Ceratopteris richardii]|uniref:Photosystem I assembly protein Ycf3 n=1 Tax=Ceratopteris richardii TaxID=49495 RepID=A0A8T2QDX2_CERRI|nr:hypothetical protein KP509_36G045200 [Ceratopteris richardii]
MSAQSEGEYAEALRSYYKAMRLEIDSYDRSYILHNIGLIHTSNGKHAKALEYYFQALERNSFLPQAFNNMAVICHYSTKQGQIPILSPSPFVEVAGGLKKVLAFDSYALATVWPWSQLTFRSNPQSYPVFPSLPHQSRLFEE